jgi:hypothetical protein
METGMIKAAGTSSERRVSLFLWLVAVHSFGVSIGMIAAPRELISFFGFAAEGELFFRVQAGVFHIVMVYVYIMAAYHLDARVILLAVAAKFTATIFLVTYYILVDPIITVLLSGILDGLMGLVIIVFFIAWRRSASAG